MNLFNAASVEGAMLAPPGMRWTANFWPNSSSNHFRHRYASLLVSLLCGYTCRAQDIRWPFVRLALSTHLTIHRPTPSGNCSYVAKNFVHKIWRFNVCKRLLQRKLFQPSTCSELRSILMQVEFIFKALSKNCQELHPTVEVRWNYIRCQIVDHLTICGQPWCWLDAFADSRQATVLCLPHDERHDDKRLKLSTNCPNHRTTRRHNSFVNIFFSNGKAWKP